ncbi:serine/threonine protein kinase [Aurantivibrio plasticivorans]
MSTNDVQSKPHPYSALTPEAILDAVESQGFVSDARILGLNSYENRVYQIGIEGEQPIIAKFYRPERWSNEQILEEHQFIQDLAELEIPVVAPLTNKAGETLFESQGFRFALFPRQGGQAPEIDNLDNLVVIGRYLGRIHAAGAKTRFKHRPSIDVRSFGEDSVAFLLSTPGFIPDELRESYTSLTRHLLDAIQEQFAKVSYQPLRLHGDCHIGNVLWRDERPHFVDFDDARNGPAVQDFWMLLSGEREQQIIQINKILDGYYQFYDFDPIELNLVESLRSLRLMYYAAWLARRWSDPAFPHNFPWFNTQRYWSQHILELREQMAAMNEPALALNTGNFNY